MEFRVLGSIEACEDGRVLPLGGPQQRRLLAVLLANAGHVVSVDRLVDAVWPGDDAPEAAFRTTRSYVSRLRAALGDGYVVTRDSGYLIEFGGAAFDEETFEDLVRGARAGDPAAAVEGYDSALAEWRGRAFGEFADEWWARPEAARLEELRLVVIEERNDALLALDRHAEAVPDLERLVAVHPYRERLTGQLMLALYRGGRQAEAHRAYHRLRHCLAEETGLEPSPELVELDRAIAAGDPSVLSATRARRLRGYVLGELLGEGGFGSVYRATQPGLGRDVALKVINAERADDVSFVRRFEAEAQLVSRLEHPHIVPLYDFWREPGGAYLVFRLLRGGNAEEALARDGRWPLERVDRLVNEVGSALVAAHAAGVVHRDVKPSNVLFDEAGHAYLADFGIAQVGDGADGDPNCSDVMASAGSSLYVSPEQWLDGQASSRSDQYSVAVTVWKLLTGQPPFEGSDVADVLALKLRHALPSVRSRRGDLPEAVDVVLSTAGAADPEDRFASMADMLLAWRQAVGTLAVPAMDGEGEPVPPRAAARALASAELAAANPYKGLCAFGEADALDFFGRAELVDRLGVIVSDNRLVAVVGPSGSGKSSLLYAGLVPRLRADARVLVASMVPGTHPLDELSVALSRVATGAVALEPARLGAERGVDDAVRCVAPEGGELVLVVDQLEELWTLSDAAERDRFLSRLAQTVAEPRAALRVVAAVRADFFDRPLQDPAIGPLVAAGTFGVTPLSGRELLDAIVEPAARVGVRFEPGLAAELVTELIGQPASLPLLQFALTELYERRDGRTITSSAYGALGGVAGAVARRGDELYASLGPADQRAAHELFTRLVTIGDGMSETRRRVRRGELAHVPERVIALFGSHRLLAFDRDPATREPTVEVAHEALLGRWPRLRAWIDEDRQWLALRRHLNTAADAWESGGRDTGELYRGARLAATVEAVDVGRELNEQERTFLEASREAERREREIDRDRLAAQRRANRRLRGLLAGVAVALVGALVAGAVAVVQNRRADEQAERAVVARESAEVGRLVALSRDLRTTSLDVALLVAVEANRRADTPATRGALQAALVHEPRLVGFLRATDPGTQSVGDRIGSVSIAFSPAGTTMAVARNNGFVELWDVVSRRLVRPPVSLVAEGRPAEPLANMVHAVRFLDEDTLLAVTRAGRIHRFSTGETEPVVIAEAGTPILNAAFSADGSEILLVGAAGGAQRRDATTGAELGPPLATTPGFIADASFSPDGARAVTAVGTGAGGDVVEWDLATGAAVGPPITKLGAGITSTALVEHSPDGGQLLTSNSQSTATVWDLATRTVTAHLEGGHRDFIRAGAFSPDGARVATVGQDGLAVVWSVSTGRPLGEPMDGQAGPTYTVAFSPDATMLALAGSDGSAVLLDLDSVGPLGRRVGQGPISAIAASPDAQTLALSGPEGVQLVDAATLETQGPPLAPGTGGGVVAFSPDDGQLALALPDGTIQRYDTADGRTQGPPLTGHSLAQITLSFSPDGRRLVSGGFDNQVVVHDLQSGEQIAPPWRTSSVIQAARFTADGSQIVVAAFDGTLALLDAETLAPVVERLNVEGFQGASSVAVRPDGAQLAAGSGDGTVTTWDLRARRPIRTFAPHSAAVYSVSYTDDGRLLATASTDGTARVVDADTGQPIGDPFPKRITGQIALAPDGHQLAVPDPDGAIVYDVDHRGWPTLACARAGRDLTALEWNEHLGSVEQQHAICAQFTLPRD